MVLKTLAELAAELGGAVVGDGAVVIRGVAGIREALPGDLTFLAGKAWRPACANLSRLRPEVLPHSLQAFSMSGPGTLTVKSPVCSRRSQV